MIRAAFVLLATPCAPKIRELGVGPGDCPHLGRPGVANPADW
jgi:hypothetical protein